MKKSKFLMVLSAFAFAIVGAFASINVPAQQLDIYAKDNNCQLSCTTTPTATLCSTQFAGPFYESETACDENGTEYENPVYLP